MCYSISVGREEIDRPENMNMIFGRCLQWYGCLPGLTDEYSRLIWQQRMEDDEDECCAEWLWWWLSRFQDVGSVMRRGMDMRTINSAEPEPDADTDTDTDLMDEVEKEWSSGQ